jgi:hypothetical protein
MLPAAAAAAQITLVTRGRRAAASSWGLARCGEHVAVHNLDNYLILLRCGGRLTVGGPCRLELQTRISAF